MNVKVDVFEKVEMELVGLDFHPFHMLKPKLFLTRKKKNGNTINQDMKIKMLFHIIENCYYYEMFISIFYILHIFIAHLFIKICHEV